MREYWIKCAQVRSTDPLVIRTRSSDEVTIALNDEEAPYRGKGQVHIVVDAVDGSPKVPELPTIADDFEPDYTQFVFQGAASVFVEGPFLVIHSAGDLWVTAGQDLLPFEEEDLRKADRITVGMIEGDPPPHNPFV